MFEAGPRHLLAHVTTLTPLLICNCPQLVRNTTLGEKSEHAACILKRHSCLHNRSPCVCYSTRSRFHEFCFRCNNLILVGQPGRWKQHTAQNGLSLLVSLAKGLCPSRLHLQQTANPVYVQGVGGGPTGSDCTSTDTWRVSLPPRWLHFLNKKTHVTHLIFKGEFPVNSSPQSPPPPLYSLIQVGRTLSNSSGFTCWYWKTDGNEIIAIPRTRQSQPRARWGRKAGASGL